MAEEAGGSLWILITVIGFIVLALALAYGTTMWNKRRETRTPGSLERAPGPAPEGAPPSTDDRRAP